MPNCPTCNKDVSIQTRMFDTHGWARALPCGDCIRQIEARDALADELVRRVFGGVTESGDWAHYCYPPEGAE